MRTSFSTARTLMPDRPSVLPGARVHDLNDVKTILDIFQAHGHYEVRSARGRPPIARLTYCFTDHGHRLK